MNMSIGKDTPYTQSLLLAAYQRTAAELLAALAQAGHGAIRHKHGAVFANLDPEGTRPSVLAQRAGITKASLGELVDELERLGYVQRRADPTDRRAKLVVPTPAAREVAALVRRVNERIERRYRRQFGDELYATLRGALLAMGPPGRALVQPRIGAGQEVRTPTRRGKPTRDR
ncbi:MAG TPA: MarR family transcriptional regulator [candidate division Zixibacteria bacterium]|nr:MarR family transcriptional regulator [candidate division Zixibacteria bacterium]